MFRFHKTLDIVTLFHKPSLSSSNRALNLLKQASAAASETATLDQASDHTTHSKLQRSQFHLDVTEDPPTADQLKNIMDYLGPSSDGSGGGGGGGMRWSPGELVEGAGDKLDALRRCADDGSRFRRPVIVDWNNGKAVIGSDESAILKLLRESPSESQDT